MDPDTDIAPHRGYSIQIRRVTERLGGTDLHYEAACCYGPDGRCVGKLSVERLQLLRDQYDAMLARRPGIAAALRPQGFETEACTGCCRGSTGMAPG